MKRCYLFGFSIWKRRFIDKFLHYRCDRLYYCNNLNEALKRGLNKESKIFVWNYNEDIEVSKYARIHNMEICRVEDGFIRSVGLGSDLNIPISLVVDCGGLYFDPNSNSQLFDILRDTHFDNKLIQRAKKIHKDLIDSKLSKYNSFEDIKIETKTDKKVILVVGQVEDDQSIIKGADGMSNLDLLKSVKSNNPNSFIIYKPHPDVVVGNRVGGYSQDILLQYCNKIVTKASLDSVLSVVDSVHTITSLVGFEALLRGKEVVVYGKPFYAGWGVTQDIQKLNRGIKRDIYELISAVLILYPIYYIPSKKRLGDVEEAIWYLKQEKNRYNNSFIYRYTKDIRNIFFRVVQKILKGILGE